MKKLNFKDFVSKIEKEIKDERYFKAHVGTLEEFVADEIYKSVKTDRNRVSELNLSSLLGIDFGEDINFIVGKIPKEYIDEHYVLDEQIKFKDAEGNLYENPNIGGGRSWKGDDKQKTREQLSAFICEHLITDDTNSLNYLGLEGPNFRSFLELYNSAKDNGVELNGTFVEYDLRTYNLMESIINSDLGQEVFKNSKVIFRDINDLIRLDFVKDEDVQIRRRVTLVHYKDTDLEFVEYDCILDNIDEGKSIEELLENLAHVDIHKKNRAIWDEGLNRDFLEMMIDRHEGKFDVVFLDYLGRKTDRFLDSLDTLVQRRINDRAIVAMAHNENGRFRDAKELDERGIYRTNSGSRIEGIFENAGYVPTLLEESKYCGESNRQNMCFQVWLLEKKE